jgi:hypothetical protein
MSRGSMDGSVHYWVMNSIPQDNTHLEDWDSNISQNNEMILIQMTYPEGISYKRKHHKYYLSMFP